MDRYHVVFQPSGRRAMVDRGTSVLDAARDLGVPLESLCGGTGTCGKCRVRLISGNIDREGIASGPEHLSPPDDTEERILPQKERLAGYRLACRARILGPAMLYVPEESRLQDQVVRKETADREYTARPAVTLHTLTTPSPSFQDPRGDMERLVASLSECAPPADLSIDLPALRDLPALLRVNRGEVTVAVREKRDIFAVWPGRRQDAWGVAVDIGTTTVAVYLCDLRNGRIVATGSMMNPQVAYGEDVMSRITHILEHPGDGLSRLRDTIMEGLNGLIARTTEHAGGVPEDVLEMTVVGNTAMHHLFLGIDPRSLGVSPFPPAVHRSLDVRARDLGLAIHPGAHVHMLPVEAGFVGADNVGVLLAVAPHRQDDMLLVIDVGTNGEMVMGNRRHLYCASCATGPALEGAHIRFGMRAAPGAIERIRIDPGTLEADFRTIGQEDWQSRAGGAHARGICGSGIIDGVAELYRAGIIDRTGRFRREADSPRLQTGDRGSAFVIARGEETAIGQDIVITQQDIRSVQLAKGALFAGARLLMRRLGVEKPDRVILAGAFGSYIDPERALLLGLFPSCDLRQVQAVGNAAGEGAVLALLDRGQRREAEEIARKVEYVELTIEPGFQDEFMSAMYFPD